LFAILPMLHQLEGFHGGVMKFTPLEIENQLKTSMKTTDKGRLLLWFLGKL
jgi:hypothetical protein